MEVKTPGIQTNKSSVCKDMALAVAYSSVNSLWKSKQKNINENLKSLCRSMILSITRCVNDYDTNWIGSTSSLITNAREAFEAVKKKHFVMDERTVHYFNSICFLGDMAVCYLVDRDKAMFSKTMSCFCSKTFNNTKGQEKVQAVAEKFGVVDLNVDPECEATTSLLNLVTNNKVEELDEMDLMGYITDIQYFDNEFEFEEAKQKVYEKSRENENTILEFSSESGFVFIAVKESDLMDDPFLAPPVILDGICRLLKDFFATESSKGYSRKGYKRVLNLLAEMKKDAKFDYYTGHKPYQKDIKEVCGILSKFKLGTLTFDGQIKRMSSSMKLVIGMYVAEDQNILNYLLPLDKDMVYMESSDWDTYEFLAESIGRCGTRIGDYDEARETMNQNVEKEENKE